MYTLDLKLDKHFLQIELLDTPAVRKWVDSYNTYKNYYKANNLDQDFKATQSSIFPHKHHFRSKPSDWVNPVINMTQKDCVDEINKAIDDANDSVVGKKFPYRAFLGMGWKHTNLMHRCFTIAMTSVTNWQHEIHKEDLKQLKKDVYVEKIENFRKFLTPEYEVIEEHTDKFYGAIERINKYIHFYEGFQTSERSWLMYSGENFENSYLQLEWDSYDITTGAHKYFFTNRINEDELKESLPDNYYEYDVFFGKSIAGKDYEFCYAEYDDPLEYDITNLDNINGSLKVFFGNSFEEIYSNSDFTRWCDGYGLEKHLYLPIPVGKVIKNTFPITSEHLNHYSENEVWSDHTRKLAYPLNNITSKLTRIIPDYII